MCAYHCVLGVRKRGSGHTLSQLPEPDVAPEEAISCLAESAAWLFCDRVLT